MALTRRSTSAVIPGAVLLLADDSPLPGVVTHTCHHRSARRRAAGAVIRDAVALLVALVIAAPGLAQDQVPGPEAGREVPDLASEIPALDGDPEYGAYLAGECTTCHQADGGDRGIPSIFHLPEEDFVIAMHAYKSEQRANPVMQMVAKRLGDEEIAALAAYFASIER